MPAPERDLRRERSASVVTPVSVIHSGRSAVSSEVFENPSGFGYLWREVVIWTADRTNWIGVDAQAVHVLCPPPAANIWFRNVVSESEPGGTPSVLEFATTPPRTAVRGEPSLTPS